MSTLTAASLPKDSARMCERMHLSQGAKDLLRPGLQPAQYLQTLVEKEHFACAVKFLAHTLPKRQAVWWACLCVWGAEKPDGPSEQEEKTVNAVHAAVMWVRDPSEENRRLAEQMGRIATVGTAAGCAAMAAFWSGGNMSGPSLPAVEPPADLTAKVAAGAVLLAASDGDPEKAPDRYRRFLAIGLEVANGSNRWE